MKNSGAFSRLWGFMIPMAFNQWLPVSLPSKSFPEVKVRDDVWRITTQGAAGGWVYFFDQPMSFESRNAMLSWEWSVEKFPNAQPSIPFKKADDDYAIRVGVLLSDGEEEIPVPSGFKKILGEKKQRIAYVVFYCAMPASRLKAQEEYRCSESPYSDRIVNCLLPAEKRLQSVSAHPALDAIRSFKIPDEKIKKLKMVGLWVFADSDNSSSESEGNLARLSVGERH